MVLKKASVGAALLGFLVAVVQFSQGLVTDRLVSGDWPWFPHLETTAQTLVLYTYVTDGVAFALGLGGVFVLGYWIGSGLDLRTHCTQFVTRVAGFGLLGYLLPPTLAALYVLGMTPFADGTPFLEFLRGLTVLEVTLVLGRIASIPIQFAIAGFAGAAFAQIRAGEPVPTRA